jgi:cytochrome c
MSKYKTPTPLPTPLPKPLPIASALLISALLIFPAGVLAHGDGHAHTDAPHEHKDFQGMKNPMAGNYKAFVEGRKIYRQRCAKCHGDTGRGDGPGAKSMTPPPPDLTADVSIHGSTDGEIFNVIANGVPKTAMPAFLNKKNLGESGVWKVVEFLKTLRRNKK